TKASHRILTADQQWGPSRHMEGSSTAEKRESILHHHSVASFPAVSPTATDSTTQPWNG
ncbi:Hypothetical predicted protein, partial [Pelobates cultripes]